MKVVKILGLALLAGLTLQFTACGKAAATGAAGSTNTGTTNTGKDQNTGAIVVGDGETLPPGATGITDANGNCYTDTDKDGKCNEVDTDIDNDGTPNNVDNDIDGDGIINTEDPDIDGDGIDNIDDNDIDGDGVANTTDPDIDGDGVSNPADTDTDGDGIPDVEDTDTNGDGVIDNPGAGTGTSTGEGLSVDFQDDGSVSMDINSIQKLGQGTHYLDFQDVRDSADKKNADVATIKVTSINVVVGNAASVAALTAYGATTVQMNIFYQEAGGAEVLVGATSPSYPVSVAKLITGISMADGTIQADANNFSKFQTLVANSGIAGVNIVIKMTVINGTLPDANISMGYVIKANAKVKI